MATLDYIIIAAYALIVLGLGFARRWSTTTGAADLIVGGRMLSLPAFVGTLVATWYGGVLGVGEYSFRYGISNWLVFGVPYYLGAFLFAILLAAKARESRLLTIPDRFAQAYDRRTALASAGLLLLLTPPAAYVLMIGVLCQLLFGWSLWVGVLIGTLASMVYVARGGFNAVVRTDVFQFILMFVGFIIMLLVLLGKFGGFDWLAGQVPPTHLTWHGGNSGWFIASWYVIALSTLVEPAFFQRCYAARDLSTAKRGVLISILFWMFFDFLTTTCGLYARAILPDLADPVAAYPALAEKVLPAGLFGLFIVALFATIMSTINAYTLIAASTFSNDIMARLGYSRPEQMRRFTWIGLIITTGLAVGLALAIGSVIDLWYLYGTMTGAALLVPLVSSYYGKQRLSPGWGLSALLAGLGGAGLWYLDSLWQDGYRLGLAPVFPGLFLSILVWLIGRHRSRALPETV